LAIAILSNLFVVLSRYGCVDLKAANGGIIAKADGTTQKGGWNIRARCRAGSPGSLDIRIAKLSAAGETNASARDFAATDSSWFLRDEVSKQLSYNWEHPKAKLLPQCGYWFSGGSTTASCSGANQVVKSIDLVAGTVTCKNIPPCAANEALRWNGSDFSCVTLPNIAPSRKVQMPTGTSAMESMPTGMYAWRAMFVPPMMKRGRMEPFCTSPAASFREF
jgi:hypothetical protein